jgi:DNA-binding IclR family transcriptional regulator
LCLVQQNSSMLTPLTTRLQGERGMLRRRVEREEGGDVDEAVGLPFGARGGTTLGRVAPPVESVRRALRILRCFSLEHAELGVSDIARTLGMHKSTVHRLLLTLETEGFVHQVDGYRYALGWRLFELGAAVPALQTVRQPVLRRLESLVEMTGETAHLGVLDEGQVLYVEKVESARPLRMPSAVGRRVPLHCTALGKVLIAGLDDTLLRSALYAKPLPAFTQNTITDPDRLKEEIKQVQETGFAVDREEIEEGLMCVAAAVVDERVITRGAISIAGPSSRVLPRLEDHVVHVKEACNSLSDELGANARSLTMAGSLIST